MQKQISYLTLATHDFQLMRDFYHQLDFEPIRESQNPEHRFVMFQSGTLILALYPTHLLAELSGYKVSGRNSAMALSLNVDSKNAVDKLLQKVNTLGGTSAGKTFSPPWGGYCGYFKDPENNLWEAVWNKNFVFTS